jgi:HEPN domain-containing protein
MSNGSPDFFEIDFLKVETKQSGDAIALRYRINDVTSIHVVDGGFEETGEHVVEHIRKYYGSAPIINRVVATHPDGDHLVGLRTVLEELDVQELWMLRPWLYASEIIHRFKNVASLDYLIRALKDAYPNVLALEEIADENGISIKEPFQGAAIGEFRVLAPTKSRYLDLVVASKKTPDSDEVASKSALLTLAEKLVRTTRTVVSLVRSAWGEEIFSDEDISAENKMSVIQYARLCNRSILLTADAGPESFSEAAAYAPVVGLTLPGIDRFQGPHHGSRRNVSTEMLDQWLGQRLPEPIPRGQERLTAIISSAKADPDHPRKSVIRALHHRGAFVASTEGRSICTSFNAPNRNWSAVDPDPYPQDQEE